MQNQQQNTITRDKQNRTINIKTTNLSLTHKFTLQTANRDFTSSKNFIQRPKDTPKPQPHYLAHHPASKFIRMTTPSPHQFKKFATCLYKSLFYSVCSLQESSEESVRKIAVKLPQTKERGLKFLMMDLDQTLIHTVEDDNAQTDVVLGQSDNKIRFNLRPYAVNFLQKMSQHYDIYVFTSASENYASQIIDFLNTKTNAIQGMLTSKHCLETSLGLHVKDLRIIRNRSLKQIVLVDNLVHSFGLQLDNGIPILEFTNNKEDKQLQGLEKLLMELKAVDDVRKWISAHIGLRKCLEIDEEQFLSVRQVVKAKSGFYDS